LHIGGGQAQGRTASHRAGLDDDGAAATTALPAARHPDLNTGFAGRFLNQCSDGDIDFNAAGVKDDCWHGVLQVASRKPQNNMQPVTGDWLG
jgi:hypothetical protein